MLLKPLAVLGVSTLLFVGCSPQKSAETSPATKDFSSVDFVHQASDIEADAAVVYGKLANGVRYAVMHNETPTKTAALRVRIDTGSFNETDDQRGAAHFIEHMAFNGSKNIVEGEMVKRLERFGLAFGADTNAYTSFDETVYTLDLPEVSTEIIDETLMIMRETVENMTLAPDAIDRERGVVQAEKRNSDSPAARAGRHNLRFLTKGSRISDRLPIGVDETLENMGAAELRSYYQSYYRPENTFVVLVGDIETDYAAAKISEYFSDWTVEGKSAEQKDAGDITPRSLEVGYFTDPEVQTSVSVSILKPYVPTHDTVDERKKAFIEGLGNRILNRRLQSLALKSDAEFLGGGAGISSLFEAADVATLSMSSRPENWQKALDVGLVELRKALKFGFTQAELDEQLANSRKSIEVAVQTAPTRRTARLAGGILSSFSSESVFSHPTSSLARINTYLDGITPDEVWGAFKEHWYGLDVPLLYLQTSVILDEPEADIQQAFEHSMSIEVEENVVQDTAKFAYTDFGTPGKIAERRHIDDVNADVIRFENNVLLNMKKTDFEKDVIRISVRVGDGSLSIPRKDNALSILAGNVMGAGGLEAHSADDIQRLMAGKAVGAGFSIGTKSFGISGSTVPSNLSDQFNLMMAQLIAPGYREESKARYDKYIESWYPTLDSTPGGVASRDVGRLLHSGDARYGIPSQVDLLTAEIDDVKSWISPQLADGFIDITVVGDIDEDAIIKEVARTFATLPTRKSGHKEYPDMTKLVFPKGQKKPVTLTHSGDENRALLQVYWPAPDGTDMMRNRRLSVLRTIFSNRLTDVIREEEGAAYFPSAGRSGSRLFKGYGYMSASLGLTPQKIPAMTRKLDEIAVDFRDGNISDDEFDRAIQPILENLDSSLESNSYWMGVISNVQTDTWNIDNFRSREKAYRNMTLSDIKPLAADIFRSEAAYRVQILPQK
jgi:zinc protease